MQNPCYNHFMKEREFEIAGQEFGERLKKIRKEKGFTQQQLAEQIGTSQRMIVHYESHVKRPSLNRISQIANALNITSDELLGITEDPKKNKKEEISYSLMKRVKVIEKLPVRDQKAIFRLINSLAEKNKVK